MCKFEDEKSELVLECTISVCFGTVADFFVCFYCFLLSGSRLPLPLFFMRFYCIYQVGEGLRALPQTRAVFFGASGMPHPTAAV